MMQPAMKIVSTNLGKPVSVNWKGKSILTGIYKYPVDERLFLDSTDVRHDHVIDRKHHGGTDMACYLYSADHYPFWKAKYPDLEWNYGMMGENLSVAGLDESEILIGDVYEVGEAVVQVIQPRQPCFKLGIRFGTQAVLKEFIDACYPGVYLRVLKAGYVGKETSFKLIRREQEGISVADVFRMLYEVKPEDDKLVNVALQTPLLPDALKITIKTKSSSRKV